MRRDVAKVMSERPKGGRTWEHKTTKDKRVVLDAAGEQINEKANYRRQQRQKGRSVRPNVIERFLFHRVGKPWDKVYAEACEAADARSKLGLEVREYLKRFVAMECWMEGRTVMSYDCAGQARAVRGLYVHPKSGLLMRTRA